MTIARSSAVVLALLTAGCAAHRVLVPPRLELGPLDAELDPARAQQLGKERGVAAVFAGHLKVTNPQASGGLAELVTPHLEATIRLDLSVRLLSTQSGGTLWRSSAWATQKVGEVALVGGELTFAARDPKTAYGPLVNRVIQLVTQDMWSTWQQQ